MSVVVSKRRCCVVVSNRRCVCVVCVRFASRKAISRLGAAGLDRAAAAALFSYFDADGSGCITLDEVEMR